MRYELKLAALALHAAAVAAFPAHAQMASTPPPRGSMPGWSFAVTPYVWLPTLSAKALVLSVDEKSQIQALDRTQPGLPLKKGRAGTMTHDYKRHGTTTLFAALNVLDGTVIGHCVKRHRHQEFIRFLSVIDERTPKDLDLHIIVDNYATHKHPEVKKWLGLPFHKSRSA